MVDCFYMIIEKTHDFSMGLPAQWTIADWPIGARALILLLYKEEWTKWNKKSTQTQAQAKQSELFQHFRKLFTLEVILIQCFQWPDISTRGNYLCACVMSRRYFVFNCGSVIASISKSIGKREKLILVLVLSCVNAAFTVKQEQALESNREVNVSWARSRLLLLTYKAVLSDT